MGTWPDVTQSYALCIESFGKNLDILPNTLELEVGDGCCMSVNGEKKYLKVLSIQSNEQKAKYLAKQLIHPTNELFDSELFGSLNNKLRSCGTSANPLEFITQLQNIRRNHAETQTEPDKVRHCEVQTDISCHGMKEVGTQINEYELSAPEQSNISSSKRCTTATAADEKASSVYCPIKITNEQISALAECLRGIPDGHVYFYLYLNKRLLPNSRGGDVLRIRKWIDERQRMHFPTR